MSRTLLFFLFAITVFQLEAQNDSPWSETTSIGQTMRALTEIQLPANEYRTFKLNLAPINQTLVKTQATARNTNPAVVLPFPSSDGRLHRYQITKSNTLHPDLAKKFPAIQTYEGIGLDDPTAVIRFEITPKGLTGMIWSTKQGTQVIQPLTGNNSNNSNNEYLVFNKHAAARNHNHNFHCQFDEIEQVNKIERQLGQSRNSDGLLRTYRLAVAANGEYTAKHGGTKAGALAAIAVTMNRVNGIIKRDVSVEFQLIPNNELIIFTNAATDGYTNDNASELLSENQTIIDNVIGNGNYDIGHVFTTGGGGVAYGGSICVNSIKAGGVTGSQIPEGDAFDVDYVAHEMGHQLGADHTQNNDCNRNFPTAVEPGSGSTIMGYAGICFPNIQNNSDAYYHSVSIDQIVNYTTGAANSCAIKTNSNNSAPIVNAGADYTLPRSTPFELEGTASDPENNTLTYSWEQIDNEAASMPPLATNTVGPAFRSLTPSNSPIRQFPEKGSNKNHPSSTWEVLPSVAREMDFRLTVRDNYSGGGCTAKDEVKLTFAQNAGPFKVNYPNGGDQISAGINQTITWDVASTNQAPVNCSTVDIFLSTDGGNTYPIVLVENVPNDGSQDVVIQNSAVTTNARIKIKGSNNIFFNVSQSNFQIIESEPGFMLQMTPNAMATCVGNAVQYAIDVTSIDGFSGDVNLSANVPSALDGHSFLTNTVSTGGSTILTVNTTNSTVAGIYEIEVVGQSGNIQMVKTVTLTVSGGIPTSPSLTTPANNANDVATVPTLIWAAATDAMTYRLEIANDQGFSDILYSQDEITSINYTLPFNLQNGSTYFWRVRASNDCGNSNTSTTRTFTVSNTICQEYNNDTEFLIASDSKNDAISPIIINENGAVESIKVSFDINHSWIGDLSVTLESPSGKKAKILTEICGNEDRINLIFSNNGLAYGAIPCEPPVSENIYLPLETFDVFNGDEANGTWKLIVSDDYILDGGALKNWSLEICRTLEQETPALNVLISNTTNPSCNGGNNGSVSATIIGGSPSYTIAWSNGASQLALNGLTAGTYSVSVTDGSGQTVMATTTLSQPTAIVLEDLRQNATCNGVNNGSIQVFPSGGTPGYSYNWANGVRQFNNLNLPDGNYSVTVTDGNNCQVSASYEITEPSPIELAFNSANAVNGQNGSIDLTVTGGAGNYQYEWSNASTTRDLNNLTPGEFAVTVTDVNGCTATDQVLVATENSGQSCYEVIVNITLDNYGEENQWDIKDGNGVIVGQAGPFNNFENETVKTAILCLPPSCYDFTIFDLWGDGMCCSYGNGAYEVIEVATGKVLASGGSFNKEETTSFCLPSAIAGAGIVEYCGAEGRNTQYEWIEKVEIEGAVFNSGSNGGYGDFTDNPVEITIGDVLDIAMTPGFGFFAYHENWQVWIDFNQDGDFDDEGEHTLLTSGNERVTGMIGIPDDAALGTTRMRIAMKWGELIDPCESFSWGEVEDFSIKINSNVNINERFVYLPYKPIFATGAPSYYSVQKRTETHKLSLFPNPTVDYLSIEWEDSKMEQYDISIVNAIGQIQEKFSLDSQKGLNKSKIQVQHLSEGIYQLQIRNKSKVITKQFVVAK